LIRKATLRKQLTLCLLIVPMAAFAANGEDFYQRLYTRGMTHFAAAEYASAFTELRSAAFGFVEQIEKFETAEAYVAVAAHRLGHDADTRESLLRITTAEKLEPHFQTLTIPDAVRAEIKTLAAALLPRQESTLLGVSREMQDAAATANPPVIVPTPSKRPNVAVTAPRESGSADAAEPPGLPPAASVDSRLADAERALKAGDVPAAAAIYDALLSEPALDHAAALRLAEGLYGTHDFAKAVRAFQKAGAIGAGEERYHYSYAVALYETGHYGDAKRELAAAIPHIGMTEDVAAYRTKIEAASK
jgi:tetratricopeptide (TPR) repeat protein